jgi:preprotein translocase subunit SecA
LSALLKKAGIKHEVLNAKQHQREALIVQQAGQPGAVTIATNMAGRGTDIVLGGNLDAELKAVDAADEAKRRAVREDWQKRHDAVISAGGLRIIGTERHESRRIDNQLRGRAGRQGDPGSSRFYLSLEDNLMRIFASERVASIMQRLGMEEGEAIAHPWVSKAIENAQRKVEAHNFDMRKNVLEYDDVANDQRKVIYQQRSDLMESEDISETIGFIREDVIESLIDQYISPGSMEEQWDTAGLEVALEHGFGERMPVREWLDTESDLHEEPLRARIKEKILESYKQKENLIGHEQMRRLEKAVMLQVLDGNWKEHLAAMDYLRQSIGLRGYAQKNPKQEYKREAFAMFSSLLEGIKSEVVRILSRIQFRRDDEVAALSRSQRPQRMQFNHPQAQSALQSGDSRTEGGDAAGHQPYVRKQKKQGRNEPCFCGSGKKYKQCHGKLE